MSASETMPPCHPDCLSAFVDTDARNEALMAANHPGAAGRDVYSAADEGLMSVRIFLQNTVCAPGTWLPACGHGGVVGTLLILFCMIWLCVQELIAWRRRRRLSRDRRLAEKARSVRREPPLL